MNGMQHKQYPDVACGARSPAPGLSSPVCVWRFLDGKAGHRNQVTGLIDALAKRADLVCHDVEVTTLFKWLRSLIPGRLNSLAALRSPTLLIGAGHATHIPMLAAKKWYGGRTVVLMKPSLPPSQFDLCLIPEADEIRRPRKNVILTDGALNRIQPSQQLDGKKGLMLIGGPSEHFGWSTANVIRQICMVIDKTPDVEWTLTTSRRTPAAFLDAWRASGCQGQMLPVDQTNADWLPSQLQLSATVWVTNESVSMIYEALTSGAAVGILTLPKSRDSRVTRGIDALIAREIVTPFDRWRQISTVPQSKHIFNEANRCAELVIQTLLSSPDMPPALFRRKAAA